MKLSDAAALLGANERYFTVVYEAFKFKDDTTLRDYIDFILHEPVEWIRGFPLKLKTRASFAKPKASLIKLLKTGPVLEALSTDYCSNAHAVVWEAFKKHADDILDAREKAGLIGEEVMNELVEDGAKATAEALWTDSIEEITDISGAAVTVPTPVAVVTTPAHNPWERKYRILRSVVSSLLQDYREDYGAYAAINTLLSVLDSDSPSL